MDDDFGQDPSAFTDAEGVYWESYRAYFLTGLCRLCGCHDDALADDLLHVFLLFEPNPAVPSAIMDRARVGSRRYCELILHVLTDAGLIEHGGNIAQSWLTPEGEDVLKRLSEEGE